MKTARRRFLHGAAAAIGLLASPGLETHRALKISGLDQHLGVHDTVEAALAATLAE